MTMPINRIHGVCNCKNCKDVKDSSSNLHKIAKALSRLQLESVKSLV